MEAELTALVAACRGKYASADKALRGIIFDFRKEWETQTKAAAPAEPAQPEQPPAAE